MLLKTIYSLLILCFINQSVFGQYLRPAIGSFSEQDREDLRDAILDWVVMHDILTLHRDNACACHTTNFPCNDNDVCQNRGNPEGANENFLPWHSEHIEDLGNYLLSIGYNKFVPLPKWDPNTEIPTEFTGDESVADATLVGITLTPPANANPGISLVCFDVFSSKDNFKRICQNDGFLGYLNTC